jgi:hypothetical protein
MTKSELSQQQIGDYQRDSCLLIPSFFDRKTVAEMQSWCTELETHDVVEITYERGSVTRCENFIHLHDGFEAIAGNNSRLARICGDLFYEPDAACLVKEKLNYKPPGGAGFMPHLDHPSLAYYLPELDTFITVMVAIDDMTIENGCLRVVKGKWDANNATDCIPPEGDPEIGGRAGCITQEGLSTLQEFDDIVCNAGDIFCFNGWVPHRSSANLTDHCRRAVFFTYNPHSCGDYRTRYYRKLNEIRTNWKEKIRAERMKDYQMEMSAFASVPVSSKVTKAQVDYSSSEDENDMQEGLW